MALMVEERRLLVARPKHHLEARPRSGGAHIGERILVWRAVDEGAAFGERVVWTEREEVHDERALRPVQVEHVHAHRRTDGGTRAIGSHQPPAEKSPRAQSIAALDRYLDAVVILSWLGRRPPEPGRGER